MNDLELTTLLDAHDALVKSCVDSTFPFEEFLALYNDFPHAYALDGHEAATEELAVLRRSNQRIEFHLKVASALSGLCAEGDSFRGPYGEAGRFGPAVGLMRMR